ncbi:MAG: polymer-forming cytoskeletal protein [Acidobacteriia bacterium]|nr:polymer-forming cytoskeletal protein [Terriglobia bacterium]MYG01953.1 polymer-forming cytoskeletal protein [Terriglobia bacterium]MYK11119.1 polymer-forming cytoskeletal protein [Terriglobia bacterium]
MWGRKEDQSNGAETLASASQASARPSEARLGPPAAAPKPAAPAPATPSGSTSRIGRSIRFKGEIDSDEDFLVDGLVDGSISVPKHSVVIGPESKVHATIEANSVLIRGYVEGKIKASDKVEISKTGRFKGDLITRRLEIHDGAVFVGSSAVHQAKPAPPAPAPPPEKQAAAELKPPASPAAAAPLKPAPAVKPASPNLVPAPTTPQRPLAKP